MCWGSYLHRSETSQYFWLWTPRTRKGDEYKIWARFCSKSHLCESGLTLSSGTFPHIYTSANDHILYLVLNFAVWYLKSFLVASITWHVCRDLWRSSGLKSDLVPKHGYLHIDTHQKLPSAWAWSGVQWSLGPKAETSNIWATGGTAFRAKEQAV